MTLEERFSAAEPSLGLWLARAWTFLFRIIVTPVTLYRYLLRQRDLATTEPDKHHWEVYEWVGLLALAYFLAGGGVGTGLMVSGLGQGVLLAVLGTWYIPVLLYWFIVLALGSYSIFGADDDDDLEEDGYM